VTASVGVASFPEHAADAESLFRAADTAMYSVKRLGKNRAASRGRRTRIRVSVAGRNEVEPLFRAGEQALVLVGEQLLRLDARAAA
jgi:predicted signal transduction protein with EAL and GGDEF domain